MYRMVKKKKYIHYYNGCIYAIYYRCVDTIYYNLNFNGGKYFVVIKD